MQSAMFLRTPPIARAFGTTLVFKNPHLFKSTPKRIITSSIASQIRLFTYSRLTLNSSNTKKDEHRKPLNLNSLTREEISKLRNMKISKEREIKGQTAINYALSVGILFLGLSYAAVVLYRTLCQRTGFGGQPISDRRRFTTDKLVPVDMDKRIKISFTSEVSDILPWTFVPQQRAVYVLPGETALAFYKAKNTGDKDIVGMATYSITPGEASPYFNKIQCFCFEEQRLAAGEEVDMPVFFFIDPDFANDPRMRNIEDLVLHYAFFKAHYQGGQIAPVNANDEHELESNKILAPTVVTA